MIGKTISKYRSAPSKSKNKDIGPKAIVWAIVFMLVVFHSKASFSQNTASLKTNAKAADPGTGDPTKSVKPSAPAEIKGDDDDTEDVEEVVKTPKAVEGQTTADPEEKEELETESTTPAGPESEALTKDENLEANDEPVAESEVEKESPVKEEKPPEPAIVKAPIKPAPEPEPEAAKLTEADYVEVIPKEKNVEIVTRKKYSNYRDRRTTSGLLINVNAENLYFSEYKSILDGALYEKLFGQEDLAMVQLQAGYKFNFILGSIVGGASYGSGTLIDDRSTEERLLTLNKKSVYAQWLVDSLMKEPYIVPYIGFNFWTMSIHEENKTALPASGKVTSLIHDTGNGTSITVGFLIQLNWLEPEVSKLAYLNDGLENTYLDVFWTEYRGTDHALDPNLEDGFNFGAGLRFEF